MEQEKKGKQKKNFGKQRRGLKLKEELNLLVEKNGDWRYTKEFVTDREDSTDEEGKCEC